MNNNKDELAKRIKNGIALYRKIPLHSQWTQKDHTNLQILHSLIEQYMDGVEVFMNDLDENPRSRAAEVFSIKDESLKSDKPATLSSSIE